MKQTRREFLISSTAAAALARAGGLSASADRPTKDDISLAAWSLNRSFFEGRKWKLLDLPGIVRKEFDINGLELVNQFFENPVMPYLQQLNENARKHGITYVLIMVDEEGDMSARDKKERLDAAIAHRKWVDIAHYLGCHAIRCNMGGSKDWRSDPDIVSRAAESFNHLLEYARGANLNVLLENHGGASSDAGVMVDLMKRVNNPNFGTLPDFGNINQGDDRFEVLRRIVPYAKGISVKASWSPDGTSSFDVEKCLQICKDAGYHGFWGIESSYGMRSRRAAGSTPATTRSPDEIWQEELKGVQLTKAVIERAVLKRS